MTMAPGGSQSRIIPPLWGQTIIGNETLGAPPFDEATEQTNSEYGKEVNGGHPQTEEGIDVEKIEKEIARLQKLKEEAKQRGGNLKCHMACIDQSTQNKNILQDNDPALPPQQPTEHTGHKESASPGKENLTTAHSHENISALKDDISKEISEKVVIPAENEKKAYPQARVRFDFVTDMKDEICLYRGEIVLIYDMDPSGWWTGECKGRYGLFPSQYVELLNEKNPSLVPKSASFSSLHRRGSTEHNPRAQMPLDFSTTQNDKLIDSTPIASATKRGEEKQKQMLREQRNIREKEVIESKYRIPTLGDARFDIVTTDYSVRMSIVSEDAEEDNASISSEGKIITSPLVVRQQSTLGTQFRSFPNNPTGKKHSSPPPAPPPKVHSVERIKKVEYYRELKHEQELDKKATNKETEKQLKTK
jgi:hypothetical protein